MEEKSPTMPSVVFLKYLKITGVGSDSQGKFEYAECVEIEKAQCPPELVAAHRKLDAAVEKAYGRKFADDAERVAFLFERYNELISKG